MPLTPIITDRLISTGPSFPNESVQTLFFWQACRKNLVWGQDYQQWGTVSGALFRAMQWPTCTNAYMHLAMDEYSIMTPGGCNGEGNHVYFWLGLLVHADPRYLCWLRLLSHVPGYIGWGRPSNQQGQQWPPWNKVMQLHVQNVSVITNLL